MIKCKIARKVPITKFHRKNFYEMLDIGRKIGIIKLLTSVYTRKIGNRMFPDVAELSKFPQKSYSETAFFASLTSPWQRKKPRGRNKSREGSTDIKVFVCWSYPI